METISPQKYMDVVGQILGERLPGGLPEVEQPPHIRIPRPEYDVPFKQWRVDPPYYGLYSRVALELGEIGIIFVGWEFRRSYTFPKPEELLNPESRIETGEPTGIFKISNTSIPPIIKIETDFNTVTGHFCTFGAERLGLEGIVEKGDKIRPAITKVIEKLLP